MSIERLSDLDELILRCRTLQSREYISEAVSCYRAGAYRAAIVSAWIAVVFDLIDKIRELSIFGDAKAGRLFQKVETYQQEIEDQNDQGKKNALKFEREILECVKKEFDFFDQHQFQDLNRLCMDRHRCAHPSFQKIGHPYRPSAEQARLHLRSAVLHVLSQQPIQGKSALAELKILVSSNYFPDSTEKAKLQLQHSAIAKPTDALLRGFVDQLFFDFLGDDPQLKKSPKIIAALNALLQMQRQPVEDRLKNNLSKIHSLSDDELIGWVLLALGLDDVWHLLSDAVKDKIKNYIKNGPIDEVAIILKSAILHDDLYGLVEFRITSLDIDSLSMVIIDFNFLDHLVVKHAVKIYSSVKNWRAANDVAEKLIFPVFDTLTKEDIIDIVKSSESEENDLIGSMQYKRFLEKVVDCNILNTSDIRNIIPNIDKQLNDPDYFDSWFVREHAIAFAPLFKDEQDGSS